MTKYLLLLALFLLMGCALQPVTAPHRIDPNNEPTPIPTSVLIAKPKYTVQRGTVAREIKLSGQVVPVSEIGMGFDLNGQVASVNVQRGDQVSADDILATLNTTTYKQELTLAENAFEVAKIRLAAAETQVANERRRAEIRLGAAQLQLDYAVATGGDAPSAEQALAIGLRSFDVEVAQLDLSELVDGIDPTLRAEVAQAQVRVDELTNLISRAQLVASDAGTVLRLKIEVGQTATAGESAVVLANLSQLEVRALVGDESDMEKLLEGQAVLIAPAGKPGDAIAGAVRLLPPPYGSGEGLAEGTIRVAFDGSGSAEFQASDRVAIDLLLAQNDDVLWLPPSAIRDFKGRHFVVIQDADVQRRVDVKLGLESDDRIEITEGVAENDTVIGP
ncbi:MAG: efflux RND transporter periplasmic adaptor subunit [Candidatus Promineifilaceae bacterium]